MIIKTKIEEHLEAIASGVTKLNRSDQGQNDEICLGFLDGTAAGYKKAMRMWFRLQGCDDMTPHELTKAVDRWYTISRVPWDGGTEFAQPHITAVSTGTKYGDNAGMVCVPSTDTQANQDDYAGHPAFTVTDCNWVMDPDTKEPIITALDGITTNFERTNPTKYVGVLQMGGYCYTQEGSDSYKIGWSTTYKPYATIEAPYNTRYRDGSFRPWTIHAKYMASLTADNKLTCCAGVGPRAHVISHNSLQTYSRNNGPAYSGGSATDRGWLQLMAFIKYGSMTLDGILNGCVDLYQDMPAQVSESGVNRIIVSTSQGANIPVGCRLLVGERTASAGERYQSGSYSISGPLGCTVTKTETVQIDNASYTAIYLDCSPFDTVAAGNDDPGTTYARTWHWACGSCDSVLGQDGSPVNCTDNKHPAKLQGIEYMVGGYEVYADTILKLYQDTDGYYYEPYIVKDRSLQQQNNPSDNYIATGLRIKQPDTANWYWISKQGYKHGIFWPVEIAGTSSTYTKDTIYLNANATGTRELLAFGHLYYWGSAGLSCVSGGNGASYATWHFLGRLSPNGFRG